MGFDLRRGAPAVLLAIALAALLSPAAAAPPAQKKAQSTNATQCAACHGPILEFHDPGKHKGVGCAACHDGIAAHLKDPQARPVTKTDPAACGACHKNQFETMYQVNYAKTARNEKTQAGGP